MDILQKEIQTLKGIGLKKGASFEKLGIKYIIDFIYNYPREYEDRSKTKQLSQVIDGEEVALFVTIDGLCKQLYTKSRLKIFKLPIKDNSGSGYAVFYNNPYVSKLFKKGDSVYLNGKIKRTFTEIQIIQPDYEIVNKNEPTKFKRIIPVYSLTKGIKQNELIRIQKNIIEKYANTINEYLPKETIQRNKLSCISQALKNIHFPESSKELETARYRLIFDELLILQLGILLIKSLIDNNNAGIPFKWNLKVDEFIKSIPFKLTNAQFKVVGEIRRDMEKPKGMYRLIQGDVGSGKTVLAFIALLNVVCNGYQGVLMAPTEILAQQHLRTAKDMLEPFGVSVELLTGSLTKKQSESIKTKLKDGSIDIIIGTHALIQDNVEFNNLGLVITDEQHRFGVKQREVLSNKGLNADVIVMTATPIPRTLGLILYSDLDISIIDELPPGRKIIKTYCINEKRRIDAYGYVSKQVKEGRQAYIVAPLIEESESIEARSVEELYEELKNNFLKDCEIGLIHGKMSKVEKEDTINAFYCGNLKVLVSTTVIEVGVNVPNASIMVIENSERFGLAQLHQLRGRVGRGNEQSHCILINYSNSNRSKERMKIMTSTNNGFIIAEKDLELRGPGDFFGTRQHGLPELKIANLFQNINELALAQKEAKTLLNKYPLLEHEDVFELKKRIAYQFGENIVI